MYNFTPFDTAVRETEEWFKRELSGIRTGRATTALLDAVRVNAYGSKMSLNQVATVGVEDARTVRVALWDRSLLGAVETAIRDANLGVSVASDESGVRVGFPELTQETRQNLLKLAKTRHEEARVAVRQEREKVWSDVQEKEKAGALSEDDKFRLKEELQERVDRANKVFDDLYEKKEKEIAS
jgi:ribosome recycling factor